MKYANREDDVMNHYLPVPIMKIAKDYGFRVIEKTPKNDDIACIIRDENDGVVKFIYVNNTLSTSKKRFLVALALAYYKLDAFENEKYYKRISLKDHPEPELMKSAMYMLVPDPLLLQILKKEKGVIENIDTLSEALAVEPNVLNFRIQEMKRRLYER